MALFTRKFIQLNMLLALVFNFCAIAHNHNHQAADDDKHSHHGHQHIHGQGQLFVIQQQQAWHFQFTLPAADLLGFEHKPETAAQQQQLANLEKQLENVDLMLKSNGQCQLQQGQYKLSEYSEHSHSHQNITAEYLLDCKAAITKLRINLFDWASSLQHLDVQWSHELGQGRVKIARDDPQLTW